MDRPLPRRNMCDLLENHQLALLAGSTLLPTQGCSAMATGKWPKQQLLFPKPTPFFKLQTNHNCSRR